MGSENYVEEIFQLVGSASVCWDEEGIFKDSDAVAIADRLCEIVREEVRVATEGEPAGNPGMTVIR